MTRKYGFVFLLFLLTLFLTLSSAVAQDAKILRIDYQQEPDSLNYYYTSQWFAGTAIDLFTAPAWYLDDNLQPYPVLVSEIPSVENGGINEDGSVITLRLRDDIVWSDGEPITSADFLFTYNMVMSDSNTVASRFPYDEKVASVETPDERTVVVTFNEPYAPWVSVLFTAVLPEHVLGPVFEAEGTIDSAEWNTAPTVSSGPFVFAEWERGSFMRYVRNENYYGGTPKLDEVFFSFIPEDATIVSNLVAGDTDIATFIAFSDTPALEETGFIDLQLVASGFNEGWFFNVDPDSAHPAMTDVNVRKALVMAFNRDQINTDLNLGQTYTPASFWEGMPYARPDAEPLPFDPEMARQLLDEAGWVDSNSDGTRDKDGVELVLRFVTNQRQIRLDVQAVAQQQLADVGIGLTLENYPSDIFFATYGEDGPVARGRFDISQWSTRAAFPDPETSRFLCSQIPSDESPDGANYMGYCNEELDQLFAQQSTVTDINARTELFHQIDQMLTDDVIWAGVWYDADLWAINSRVIDARISGSDPFWNAVNWDIAS